MNQIGLKALADPPNQQCIGPKQRGYPGPTRGFQNMERYSIAFEGERRSEAPAQQDHMKVEVGIFFKFRQQRHLPGSWMTARQCSQRHWKIRQPFDWKIRN